LAEEGRPPYPLVVLLKMLVVAYLYHLSERQVYGEAKRWHGLGRCRYLGLWRYGIQAYLTALVLNLKRIVVLLRGGVSGLEAGGGRRLWPDLVGFGAPGNRKKGVAGVLGTVWWPLFGSPKGPE
jgi:hypothetical protein